MDKLSVDAVFQRISELYGVESDAGIGRKLGGLSNQSVYTYRKREKIPYGHIVANCPPGDWEYLFLGTRTAPAPSLDAMIRAVLDAGYRVEKASPERAPGGASPEGPNLPPIKGSTP